MLTRDIILRFLREQKQLLTTQFSVKRIGVFGSFARGESGAGSDLDILVELEQPTFDHYMELKFFLEDNFKIPVDLVLADTLKPRLRPIISREVAYA